MGTLYHLQSGIKYPANYISNNLLQKLEVASVNPQTVQLTQKFKRKISDGTFLFTGLSFLIQFIT